MRLPEYYKAKVNVFYDMYPFNSAVLLENTYPVKRQLELYKHVVRQVLTMPDNPYKTKYVLMRTTPDLAIALDEYRDKRKVSNILSAVLHLMRYDLAEFKDCFRDTVFVLLSDKAKAFIWFRVNDFDKDSFRLLYQSLKKLNKRELSIEEVEEVSDDAVLVFSKKAKQQLDDTGSISDSISAKEYGAYIDEIPVSSDLPPMSRKIVQKLKAIFNIDERVKGLTGEEREVLEKIEEITARIEKDKKVSTERELEAEIAKDQEFLEYLNRLKDSRLYTVNRGAKTEREKFLKSQQSKLTLAGRTLEDILKETKSRSIDTNKLLHVNTRNIELIESTVTDLEENYLKKQDLQDKVKVLEFFSREDRAVPLYIKKIEKKDTSDAFNKKETWTIHFEDDRKKTHRVTLDVPILVDNKFLYLNDSKKFFKKQLILLPVVKTGPDTVVVTTNFSKTFVTRFGQKISPKLERLRKFLTRRISQRVKFKIGDNLEVNKAYLTNIDYDCLAQNYNYVQFGPLKVYFNQNEIRKELVNQKLFKPKQIESLKPYELPIAIGSKGVVYFLNTEENSVYRADENLQMDLSDFLIEQLKRYITEENYEKFRKLSTGKKYIYTRAKILYRQWPIGILLTYLLGLVPLLERANIKYEVSPKRRQLSMEEKHRLSLLEFKDVYLYYHQYPFQNSLLLNSLRELPLKEYTLEQFNTKEIFYDIFYDRYGSRTIIKGLENFTELFVDPITEEVLIDMGLPTTFADLMIYANSLLVDNSYVQENDMSIYRCRSIEVINTLLYNVLAKAYREYKDSRMSVTPHPFTVNRDALIKEINKCQIINDYSVLSPILEVERQNTITFTGPGGLNLAEAFTLDKRSYHESMLGILALSSPFDNKVGVNRELTYNPNIQSVRGYLKITEDNLSGLKGGQILSFAELLTPLAAYHDDAMRTALTTTQSKHQIPIEKADKLLVGYGAQKTMPYLLSNDFVFKAKYDGKVIEIDEKHEWMIVEYTDKKADRKYDVIDLSHRMGKNSGGGFWISNQKLTDYKVGDRFKKNEILARNTLYFKGSRDNTEYVIGNLAKIMVHGGYYTFEDSSLVTEQFSREMTSYITVMKHRILGVNANVHYIVKKGQKVKTGDPLIIFDQSFSERSVGGFLEKIAKEYKEEISEYSRNIMKSKYTGEIVDVRIYYTVEKSKLSPSLQKLVTEYASAINKRKKAIRKFVKDDNEFNKLDLHFPPTSRINNPEGRVKTKTVGEGVLIEIYIKYRDTLTVGDKLTFYSALKSIVAEVVSDDLAPYSEYRPDEQVKCVLSYTGVQARMVNSVFLTMFANKILIELKRKVKDIFFEKG